MKTCCFLLIKAAGSFGQTSLLVVLLDDNCVWMFGHNRPSRTFNLGGGLLIDQYVQEVLIRAGI